MSVEQVKATIAAGTAAIDEALQITALVRDSTGSARSAAAATAQGSVHDAVQRGLRLLVEADHEADLTIRRLRASTSAADRYLGLIG